MLCSRPAARALLSRPSRFSALVPPRALLVFGAGARSRTFVCMRLRRVRRDNAVTCCKNCHANAQRIQAARPPFIPAAIYLHLSRHTTQQAHPRQHRYDYLDYVINLSWMYMHDKKRDLL